MGAPSRKGRTRAAFALAAMATSATICEPGEPVGRPPILLDVKAPAGARPREFLRPHRDRLQRAGRAVTVRVSDGPGPSISIAAFSGGVPLSVERFDPHAPLSRVAVRRWLDSVATLADASRRRRRPPVEAPKPRLKPAAGTPALRIDGTSGEAFRASLEAIVETLDEEERRDLRSDIFMFSQYLPLKAMADAAEAGRPVAVEDMTGFFHGMTAAELHAEAEAFRAARDKAAADPKAERGAASD